MATLGDWPTGQWRWRMLLITIQDTSIFKLYCTSLFLSVNLFRVPYSISKNTISGFIYTTAAHTSYYEKERAINLFKSKVCCCCQLSVTHILYAVHVLVLNEWKRSARQPFDDSNSQLFKFLSSRRDELVWIVANYANKSRPIESKTTTWIRGYLI